MFIASNFDTHLFSYHHAILLLKVPTFRAKLYEVFYTVLLSVNNFSSTLPTLTLKTVKRLTQYKLAKQKHWKYISQKQETRNRGTAGATTTSTGLLKSPPPVTKKTKMPLQNVIYSGVQAYFAFRSYEYLRAFNEAWFGINEFKVNEN